MSDYLGGVPAPPPGAVAWLHVGTDDSTTWTGRLRTGPLGLQIAPLRASTGPYFFKGARLRGNRCIWSASTVNGAMLHRPARSLNAPSFENGVHLMVRMDAGGSVFDPVGTSAGQMRVVDPSEEITEQFSANTHLYTLNVPLAATGVEPAVLLAMQQRIYPLTAFQSQLLRGAVGVLLIGGDELTSASSLIGVDRYLAALAALLVRTAVDPTDAEMPHAEQVRSRADAIIHEQAVDPNFSPAAVAEQLNISLRQLYRACNGSASPAARIRTRRLQRAAEILVAPGGAVAVETVALACGFASAEYFSRAFRREFGMSPRAYRSSHREALAH